MGVDGERFDDALDAAKKRPRRRSRTRTSMPPRCARSSASYKAHRRARPPAASSRPIRSSSSTWPSRPSSRSWFGKRAHDYRDYNKIAHDLGTAVNVVTMVFGNMGDDSGTGVAFTRDPNTGEKVLYGEYLTNAQGEDVVAGIRTPQKIASCATRCREVVRRVPADRRAARAPLSRRPGPRVHDRARPAVHAPDAERQADRRRGREDRGRHGRRGHHHRSARRVAPHRARAGRPAAARPVRPEGPPRPPRASPRA